LTYCCFKAISKQGEPSFKTVWGLGHAQLAFEVDRLTREIIEKMPSDLWSDERIADQDE